MHVLVFLLLFAGSAKAVPVVPQFRTGTQTSNTRSTTQMVEQIKSVNFSTGYTYSVSGTGVTSDGALIPQGTTTQNVNVDGITSNNGHFPSLAFDASHRPGITYRNCGILISWYP